MREAASPPLREHAFEQRKSTLIAILDRLGDLVVDDVGKSSRRRRLMLAVTAPSGAVPVQAAFVYSEVFERRGRDRWEMIAYLYEYRPTPAPSRRACHWHAPWAYHAHCVDPQHPERTAHYRSPPVDIFWAHGRFYELYVREQPVTCDDLHPL